MAFMEKVIVIVAIVASAMMIQICNGYSTCNITVKREPVGRVELIELMLPRHAKNGNGNINYDTKTSTSEEETRFEIFIKQNKKGGDMKNTPKIKIFVESDEYSSGKQLSKSTNGTPSNFHGNKDYQYYQPVPLTIKNAGFNAARHTDKDGSETLGSGFGKGPVYSFKSHDNNTKYANEAEGKDSHYTKEAARQPGGQRVKDTEGETKLYPDGYNFEKNDERDEKISRSTEESLIVMSKSEKPFEVKQTMAESTTRKEGPEALKASIQQPLLYENPTEREREYYHHRHRHELAFESLPAPYHKDEYVPPAEKELVYKPDEGISVTHINSYNGKRFAEHPKTLTSYAERDERGTDTEDFEYEETRPSNSRTLSSDNIGVRPVREEVSQGRNRYLDNNRHSTGGSSSSNGYTRGGIQYSVENTKTDQEGSRRSDGRYSSEGKRVHNSDNVHYMYDRPEDTSGNSNTEIPYQLQSHKDYSVRRETTTIPQIPQNAYSGFPESNTGNAFESSRQTPYEGPSALPASPCPTVFKYTRQEGDRWYADIYVSTDVILNGMRLDVMLSKRANILAAFSAEVKSTDNLSFTILSLKKTLVPGTPEVVQIFVTYNVDGSRPAPFLKTINLNGRMICPAFTNLSPKSTTKRPTYAFPGDIQEQKRTTERIPDLYTRPVVNEYITTPIPSSSFKRTTTSTDFKPAPNPDAYEAPSYSEQSRPVTKKPNPNRPVFSHKPAAPGVNNNDNRRPISTSNNNNYGDTTVPSNNPTNNRKPIDEENRNIPCGLPAIQPRPLITNGQKTSRGQWPWHAAIYRNIGPNLSYSCGGSLVTNLHVITAAHCATREYTTAPMDPKMLLVYFGKYHLRVWTENGIANREVARVNVHPNYNATDFRSDIAVLTLSNRVEFTDFIRPVCLWDRRNTRIEDIVGQAGTVVGWGFDETKELTEELKQAKMPIVKHNECLWSYPDFYPKFTSNTTYCAGFKNGTSVCNGDSGGGMVFPIKVNREERWFLRGLVSLSPGLKDTRICDTHQYVVFTDVAKFLPWLEDLIL